MVLMNSAKSARNAASLVNRTNTCGGVKKGGLHSSVGNLAANQSAYSNATNTQYGLCCIGNFTNPSQSTYRRAVRGLF